MARRSSRSSEVSNAKDAHCNNGDTSSLIKPQAPPAPLAMEESSSSSSSSLFSSRKAKGEREAAVRGRGRGRGRGGGSIRAGPTTTTTATPTATTTTARGTGKWPASAALDSSAEGSPPPPGKATQGGKGRGRGGSGRGRGRGRGGKKQQQRRVTFQANDVIIQSPRTKQQKRKHEGPPPVFTFKKATAVNDEDLTTASAATAVAASPLSPSSSATSSLSSSAAGDDSPAQKKKTSRAPSKAVNEDGTGDYSGMGKAEDIDYFADVISTDDADDGEDGDVIKRDLLGLQHLMTRHFVDVSNLGTYPVLTPSHPTFDWNTAPARTTIKALAELINSHEAGLQANHAVMSIGPLEVGKEDMSILASGSSIFLLTIGGDATLDLTSRGGKFRIFLKSGSLTKIGMKTAAAATRVLTPRDQSALPIMITFRCVSRLHDPLKVLRTLSVNKPSIRTTASRVASLVNK